MMIPEEPLFTISFVYQWSISVAVDGVTLVGLVMVGKYPCENMLSR